MGSVGGVHVYLSTACYHGQHERCRLNCKFCHIPCECLCHRGQDLTTEEHP